MSAGCLMRCGPRQEDAMANQNRDSGSTLLNEIINGPH